MLPPHHATPLTMLLLHPLTQVLPCGHFFHYTCLRSWLEQSNSCPICRASLTAIPARSGSGSGAGAGAGVGGGSGGGAGAIVSAGYGPAMARLFASATGGGDHACGQARLGLGHGGKKGERRDRYLPNPEGCPEGSARMHCLRNFWGAEGGYNNLCCEHLQARRRCEGRGKGTRGLGFSSACRQRPRGPTRTRRPA